MLPFAITASFLCTFYFQSFLLLLGTSWLSLIVVARRAAAVFPEIGPFGCGHCGYDLRGSLQIGRCPECGTRFGA